MATSNGNGGGRQRHGGDGKTPGHQARLDSFVPTFDQQKNYREFRKRCELCFRKMQMGNRQSEMVFNIVTLLNGKAWDLVEDFSRQSLQDDMTSRRTRRQRAMDAMASTAKAEAYYHREEEEDYDWMRRTRRSTRPTTTRRPSSMPPRRAWSAKALRMRTLDTQRQPCSPT